MINLPLCYVLKDICGDVEIERLDLRKEDYFGSSGIHVKAGVFACQNAYLLKETCSLLFIFIRLSAATRLDILSVCSSFDNQQGDCLRHEGILWKLKS